MSKSVEMFRFMALRRPQIALAHELEPRLVRDRRDNGAEGLLARISREAKFRDKLEIARDFTTSRRFVTAEHPLMPAAERLAARFRAVLAPGLRLGLIVDDVKTLGGDLANGVARKPTTEDTATLQAFDADLWDSVYATTIIGFKEWAQTNPLADALRVLQVLRLVWTCREAEVRAWPGWGFDDYDLIIGAEGFLPNLAEPTEDPGDAKVPVPPPPAHLADLDDFQRQLDDAVAKGEVAAGPRAGRAPVLNAKSRRSLAAHPAVKDAGLDLEKMSVEELNGQLARRRVELSASAAPQPRAAVRAVAAAAAPASTAPGTPQLSVGEIAPPTVGDLLLVEQELLAYEMGEIADIQNVLKGEQREHSTRNLSRVTETSSTESESSEESSTSKTTDERYSLSSEAERTAEQTLAVSAGVSVSGSFGPISATVNTNASYSNSKSQSDSVSQETAKSISETATNTVSKRIKESSSLTILTESEQTSLQGFNNTAGTAHVCGIYRWIDKLYAARTVNYGRRLMLEFMTPEPAAFFRAVRSGDTEALTEGLVKPHHPNALRITSNGEVLEPGEATAAPILSVDGPDSLNDGNYTLLAAYFDTMAVQPPPPLWIAKSQALSYPVTGQAAVVKDHDDQVNELSLVDGSLSLSVDPAYRLRTVGVFAPLGELETFGMYADTLKLGMRNNDENLLVVAIGNRSFHFSATESGGKRTIKTNFNVMQDMDETSIFGKGVTESLPVAFTADFEGLSSMTIIYTATRSDEAYAAWQIATYDALLQAYNARLSDYEDKLAATEAKAVAEAAAITAVLRDSQYRTIEQTELKRCCIELLTEGSAVGFNSIDIDGTDIEIEYDEPTGSHPSWRSPYANGAVASFFESAFEWDKIAYSFFPYFWTLKKRWPDLMIEDEVDPVFAEFLKAGMARVTTPVTPGFERSILAFLRTGRVWTGGYLPLTEDPLVLDAHQDAERGRVIDPPEPVGDPWDLRLPTSLIKLQAEDTLPTFTVDWWTGTAAAAEPPPASAPATGAVGAPF